MNFNNLGFVDIALVLIIALFVLYPVKQEAGIEYKLGKILDHTYWGRRHSSAIKVGVTANGMVHFIGVRKRFSIEDKQGIDKQINEMVSEYPTDRVWMYVAEDVPVTYTFQVSNLFKKNGVHKVAFAGNE
ncbi:hypothetical protein L1286_21930 [Pseudoalteromonas sp. SMS1]|uniref:biopolymer transporter ExbD n=1 Tax=Pseudoalteromonas sp. SMS1 TaxID=2908894 RepID=UPI001F1661DA|nr:biopolymer transporter ExbD [Pseudoalteromonas sp. SMS1]MCF2860145.1 hypothetical protein [Pseudoalteromonas sp. SMS1]